MSTAAKVGAVLATTAGAGLVAALLLPWWGLPPALLDPPADLPEELSFLAEGMQQRQGEPGIEHDAFKFFEIRDIIWLATGLAGFALGLTALLGSRLTRPLAYLVVGLALVATVLVALPLISPPDYAQITADLYGGYPFPGLDYDLPLGREVGPWLALAASIGIVAGSLPTLRSRAV